MPFMQVTSASNFYEFLDLTIPEVIFTEDSSNALAFTDLNPPVGGLTIRTQHWDRPECPK